jgi:hypothetical protein
MHPNLSSLLPAADIDVGRSFGANMFLLVEGTNAEHRTGPPLTLATMADAYGIGIGGYFNAQGTTTEMRGFVIVLPPYPGTTRLQKGGCQSDRRLVVGPTDGGPSHAATTMCLSLHLLQRGRSIATS